MSRFEDLNVGDVLVGQVTQVVPFGVFVRISHDADGLLYGQTEPAEGATVTVRILEIDREKRRASLARA
jgi:ribosomal protein S1